MEKINTITNNKIEKFRLNFSNRLTRDCGHRQQEPRTYPKGKRLMRKTVVMHVRCKK